MTQAAQAPAVPALPFTASAHEHVEPAFTLTVTPGAVAQQLNPVDIPAAGYARYLFLEVSATGGVGGTIAADGPWNLFQSINLADVNGANIFGPLSGYSTFIANLLGGYAPRSNPVDSPDHVGSAPNPSFILRIPIEINRKNGLGSIGNQNAAAEYKLSLAINTLAAMFSVAPSPVPTYTIRGWLEGWTLPAPHDARGRLQSQVPPLLGTGQFWTSRVQSGILVGENEIGLRRLGNYVRLWAFIARDASGVRSNSVFPDPVSFEWDGITIRKQSQRYMRQEVYEKTLGTVTLPTGVFAIPFNHGGEKGLLGNEDPDLWLPTSASSRIRLVGSSAAAGSVEVLTNDVATVEQDQTDRYQVPNATGEVVAGVR